MFPAHAVHERRFRYFYVIDYIIVYNIVKNNMHYITNKIIATIIPTKDKAPF